MIPNRSGQILRNELLDAMTPLGPPPSPAYTLSVQVREDRQDFAIRRDETTTRTNLVVTARYALRRAGDDRVVHSGTAIARNSFDVLSNKFATITAEDDARTRVLQQVAAEIRIRLAVFFNDAGA